MERTLRSDMWRYFERGGEKSQCKLCSKSYVRHSGVTNLLHHLKKCHLKEFASIVLYGGSDCDGDRRTSAGTKPLGAYFGSKHSVISHSCSPARAGQITDLILDWVVDSTCPLSIVPYKGLVQFLAFLEPA